MRLLGLRLRISWVGRGRLWCGCAGAVFVIFITMTIINSTYLPSKATGTPNSSQGMYMHTAAIGAIQPLKYYSNNSHTAVFDVRHKSGVCRKGTARWPPKLVIIGGTKCSTESVSAMINLHPQMRSEEKEVNYFPLNKNLPANLTLYGKRLPCTRKDQIAVDRSAMYLYQSKVIPQQMYNMASDMKLLMLVRDPVDRVISHFVYRRDARHVIRPKVTLRQYVLKRNGEVNAGKDIITSSRYYEHLQNWLKYFPRNQILVIPYEIIKYTPHKAMYQIEEFMNLDHLVTEDMFVFNRHKGFYCYMIDGVETCLNSKKGLPHEKFSDSLMTKLIKYYHPYNLDFYRFMGKDYEWKRP